MGGVALCAFMAVLRHAYKLKAREAHLRDQELADRLLVKDEEIAERNRDVLTLRRKRGASSRTTSSSRRSWPRAAKGACTAGGGGATSRSRSS